MIDELDFLTFKNKLSDEDDKDYVWEFDSKWDMIPSKFSDIGLYKFITQMQKCLSSEFKEDELPDLYLWFNYGKENPESYVLNPPKYSRFFILDCVTSRLWNSKTYNSKDVAKYYFNFHKQEIMDDVRSELNSESFKKYKRRMKIINKSVSSK